MVFYAMHYPQFTSFVPNCSLNQHLSKNSKSANSHSYRQYLQKNATKIMEELKDCTGAKTICKICPVCDQALVYKPEGNIPAGADLSKITTNKNPYSLNPNI